MKLLHQSTKIYRYLYAKVLLQTVQCPSDNPTSDSPTFKENTPHIDISQLKLDSNDTIPFSKLYKFDAKFDALKILATREISELANKFIGFKRNMKNF